LELRGGKGKGGKRGELAALQEEYSYSFIHPKFQKKEKKKGKWREEGGKRSVYLTSIFLPEKGGKGGNP